MERTPNQLYWRDVAQNWGHWGPPLRPSAADIRLMERALREWGPRGADGPSEALLWGVTPEIAGMKWPAQMQVLAIDRAPEMIEFVWPGDVAGRRRAECGDWLAEPVQAERFAAVVGDGVFSVLRFPDEYGTLLARALHVLQPGGLLIARLFTRLMTQESAGEVLASLRRGEVGSFHAFKLRLAMALQQDAREGVRVGDVHAAWLAAGIRPEELARERGWTLEAIQTVDYFKGREARLSFPTLAEFDGLLTEGFERLDWSFPEVELGERCPVVCYRKR